MRYVDGFVVPVPKKKLAAYRRMAAHAAKIWREHGALEVYECAGDDIDVQMCMPFTKLGNVKKGETPVFSWIAYRSRAHRDRVNKKVMKDERILALMKKKKMPFDGDRMAYGGFQVIVKA